MKNMNYVGIAKLLVIIMTCICIATGPVYADTENNIVATEVCENEYIIEENGEASRVTFVETDNYIKTEIEGTDSGYFLYDKQSKSLYSSYTGKSICLEDDSEVLKVVNGSTVQPQEVVDTIYKKISYADLAQLVSATDSAVSKASAILSILNAKGFPIKSKVGIIVDMISGSLSIINSGLKDASPKHGLKIKINKVKVTKHQAGQVFHTYKYVIAGISNY